MSNGSKHESKGVNKNFIVDYRNGKYQGELAQKSKVPHGIGMFLTIQYQLVIAKWSRGHVDGQCLIFYPNGNIFIGNIIDKQTVGTNVFFFSKRKTLYNFEREGQNLILLNCQVKKTIIVAKILKGEIDRSLKQNNKQAIKWIFSSIDRLNQKAVQILQTQQYTKDDEKYAIIQRVSGGIISSEYLGYKNYLKQHFNAKIKNRNKRIQVIQTNKYAEIRYKTAGIVIRINNNKNQVMKVKLLGYYDHHQEKCQIFIKNKSGFQPQFQQFCQGHTLSYDVERPHQCKTTLLNYFRKSTNFVDKFISLQSFKLVQNFSILVLQLLDEQMSMKSAQQQLQMGYNEEINQQETNQKHKISHQSSYQTFQLVDVKNDLLQKVNRKRTSNNQSRISPLKSVSQSRFQNSNRPKYQIKQQNDNYKAKSSVYRKYLEQQPSSKGKRYLQYTQSSPTLRQISRKKETSARNQKYFYLPRNQYNQEIISDHYHYQRPQLQLDLNRVHKYNKQMEKQNNKIRKDAEYQNNAYMNDSIGTLANNYQRINKQIQFKKYSQGKRYIKQNNRSREGTPTSKSPSRFNYLKSPSQSPLGTPKRGKRQWR